MRRHALSAGGWFGAACLLVTAWSCSGSDTNPFGSARRQPDGTSGASGGGTSGASAGTDSGSSGTSGTSGASTGGEANGGMTTGGSTGDGGAAADSGNDAGGTTSGDAGMGGKGGNAGTPAVGGAGMSGSPTGGAGASAGAGTSGGGAGSGGMSGTGGTSGGCKENTDCGADAYCRKESCDAEYGECEKRGPDCLGYDAEFYPVCGCDGITYWNECVIEHEGANVARAGECTDDDDRPTCTRTGGGESCSAGEHAHCYRPVEMCGDASPMMGFCWVLPAECPDFEPQDQRYCGGTAGEARCIGLCEVIQAENSFRRDAPTCED